LKRKAQWQPDGRITVEDSFSKSEPVSQDGCVCVGTVSVIIEQSYYVLEDVRGYDYRARPVDRRSLPRLLKNPVSVLVSADGRGVDRSYLRSVKKGTLILVVSPPVAPNLTEESLRDFDHFWDSQE
jgi:hypothetical protein